jgi:hypothetical protein
MSHKLYVFISIVFCIAVCTTETVLAAQNGIWISSEELKLLPTTGPAWDQMKKIAYSYFSTAVGGNNDNHDVKTLAQALVAARVNNSNLKKNVVNNLLSAIGSEKNGNSLSISRNLVSYVIAADVINFKLFDPANELKFRDWVKKMVTMEHDGGGCAISRCSIPDKHEDRPNNHGTMAGASRAAAAIYLGNNSELQRSAQVFKGYLGDRYSYAGFKYGSMDWQADPKKPVGINPKDSVKNGYSIDGVLPDDMRRGGGFQYPPKETGYVWEALQGAVVQAEILYRAEYDTWHWENNALLRAVKFLYSINWPAVGDDQWILYIINYRYGTKYITVRPVHYGKNMGWTDWTHASKVINNPP